MHPNFLMNMKRPHLCVRPVNALLGRKHGELSFALAVEAVDTTTSQGPPTTPPILAIPGRHFPRNFAPSVCTTTPVDACLPSRGSA